jgi:dihydrolipoamide dehydrogenase
MPSKVLIQAANDFHRRNALDQQGILGGKDLYVDTVKLMAHVRSLRDRFVSSVIKGMDDWREKHLIRAQARFVDDHTLDVGGKTIEAEKIIIATGSTPIIPKAWAEHREDLITTDEFFELTELPKKMAIIGLGVIGLELGQALHRLGRVTVAVGLGRSIAGITDPELQDYTIKKLNEELPLHLEGVEKLTKNENGLEIQTGADSWIVEKALVAIGRRPNVHNLGLENTSFTLDDKGIPLHNPNTGQIGSSSVFIAGDATGLRLILHEAADEGHIAGLNSVGDKSHCFQRRTPLGITFSDPNIAVVGQSYQQLVENSVNFVSASVSFEGQGRSIVKLKEKGLLKIYADKSTGKLLGAELFAPEGEHLAHMIAWAIQQGLNVYQALSLPYYHPVVAEGLRTAIRRLGTQTDLPRPELEIPGCGEGVPCT